MEKKLNESFIQWLESLREDRGALAKLKRGLHLPEQTPDLYPFVVPFTASLHSVREEVPYYQVAALFGFHPEAGGNGSIGCALLRIKNADPDNSESLEKRFINLLSAHIDDLYHNLRQIVSLLKTNDIPVDWLTLLNDLHRWDHPEKFVQKRWARDFWA